MILIKLSMKTSCFNLAGIAWRDKVKDHIIHEVQQLLGAEMKCHKLRTTVQQLLQQTQYHLAKQFLGTNRNIAMVSMATETTCQLDLNYKIW